MKSTLTALTIILMSSNAFAGLVCGQMSFYSDYSSAVACAQRIADTGDSRCVAGTIACGPGKACVRIAGKLYKFDEKTTDSDALDDLFFASETAMSLILEKRGNNTCLILDNKGKLKSASTEATQEA